MWVQRQLEADRVGPKAGIIGPLAKAAMLSGDRPQRKRDRQELLLRVDGHIMARRDCVHGPAGVAAERLVCRGERRGRPAGRIDEDFSRTVCQRPVSRIA
jgi:hypothetical protein